MDFKKIYISKKTNLIVSFAWSGIQRQKYAIKRSEYKKGQSGYRKQTILFIIGFLEVG